MLSKIWCFRLFDVVDCSYDVLRGISTDLVEYVVFHTIHLDNGRADIRGVVSFRYEVYQSYLQDVVCCVFGSPICARAANAFITNMARDYVIETVGFYGYNLKCLRACCADVDDSTNLDSQYLLECEYLSPV